jgi:hypothetical protein
MISDLLITKLQHRFPNRGLRVGAPPDPCAVFPGVHPEVGDVIIMDDGEELTLYAGKFTHGHFSNYEDNLTKEQKAVKIVEDVADFLEDLFADRVILWGSHLGGGGWCKRDAPLKLKSRSAKKNYVWSGPLNG